MEDSDFTAVELDFLERLGVASDEVYDARGKPKKVWATDAKALGFDVIIGSPCRAGGHRLRTRAGHCIQCDISKFAYQSRHRTPGYVYVAKSLSADAVKIGSTLDIGSREKNLRGRKYGGVNDWRMIAWGSVDFRGESERAIQTELVGYSISGVSKDQGRPQQATELFRVPEKLALEIFLAKVKAAGGRIIYSK